MSTTTTDDARRARDMLRAMKAKLDATDEGVRAARELARLAGDVRATIAEVEDVLAMPRGGDGREGETTEARLTREAREAVRPVERAKEALGLVENDERAVFATWDALVELDLDSRAIRAALLGRGSSERVERGFDGVDEAWVSFEKILWNALRQSILAGKSGASALVRCVRVVVEQEALDAEYERDAEEYVEEIDETTNRVLNMRPPEPKRWKMRVFQEMSSAVEVRLALIAEGFSGPRGSPGTGDDRETIEHVLNALDESLVSLADMYDYTIPAFPPDWRVFETIVAPTYHAGVCDLLARLSASPNNTNGDMVTAVTWAYHYFAAIQSLGLDIETSDEVEPVEAFDLEAEADAPMDDGDAAFPPLPYPHGLAAIIDAYCDRLINTIASWTENLSRAALTKPPKPDNSGKLWTPTDVEFFRMITDQMRIATGTKSSVFVRRCGRVAAAAVYDFASFIAERLSLTNEIAPRLLGSNMVMTTASSRSAHEGSNVAVTAVHDFTTFISERINATNELPQLLRSNTLTSTTSSRGGYDGSNPDWKRLVPFECVVAGVNDTKRCRELSKDMQMMILGAMGGDDAAVINTFEQAIQKMNRIHAEARKLISRRVLDDPGLSDVFAKFYGSNPHGIWASGEAMTILLATVEDYMGDIEVWLAVEVADSVMETLFEHLIELLFSLFTKQLVSVAPHTVQRLSSDERELMESMKLRMSENKALGRIARLHNLRELVSAGTGDDFKRAYGVLLANWPDAGVDVVDTILRARADFDKTSARSALESCRDMYIARVAELSGDAPAALGAQRIVVARHRRAPNDFLNSTFKTLLSPRRG